MKKFIYYNIAICLLLFLFGGCKKEVPQENIDRIEVRKEVFNAAQTEIVNQAIEKFNEKEGSGRHQDYEISVRESSEEWTVYFEGKTTLPGNHAWVTIKKGTGEIMYMPGE